MAEAIDYFPARQLSIRVPAAVPVFADGDELIAGNSAAAGAVVVDVELVPGAVRLLG